MSSTSDFEFEDVEMQEVVTGQPSQGSDNRECEAPSPSAGAGASSSKTRAVHYHFHIDSSETSKSVMAALLQQSVSPASASGISTPAGSESIPPANLAPFMPAVPAVPAVHASIPVQPPIATLSSAGPSTPLASASAAGSVGEVRQPMCMLCLDLGVDHFLVNCGHQVHLSCVKSWLKRKPICPDPFCGVACNLGEVMKIRDD